jgi:hypothetical protein
MSREFSYPVVIEIRRDGRTTAPDVPQAQSQRELVEASLLRCPPSPAKAGKGRAERKGSN